MEWSKLGPVLLDILSEIAADPIEGSKPFRAQWDGRPAEMVNPHHQHALFLSVTTVEGIGEDEQRYAYDGTRRDAKGQLGVVTATNCGMRRINLQLRSECYENTDDNWCLAILDRIYTRMSRTRYIDRLRDECNATWIDSSIARTIPVIGDKHALSAGTLNLILYAAVNEDDPVPFGWIERVKLSSDISAKTDLDNELVPPA